MTHPHAQSAAPWHGTTILSARSADKVVIIGDGQVSMGQTVMKPNARKVRRLHDGSVIGGFAGATADAFTLFERLEAKLERHNGQLLRAAVELAKDWRTDKYLRNLEAMESSLQNRYCEQRRRWSEIQCMQLWIPSPLPLPLLLYQ